MGEWKIRADYSSITKAKELAHAIHRITKGFPWSAQRAAAQLNEAADSVSSNIAEGCGRKNARLGNADLVRFCLMANGSVDEVRDRLESVHDRGLVCAEAYERCDALATEVRKMLSAFISGLQRKDRERGRGSS